MSGNLQIEGEKLEIISVEGAPERTFVCIPSIKAVVGSINVFGNDFHLWTAGHFGIKANLTEDSVDHTKNYLQVYDELLKTKKTSKALISSLQNKYPNLHFQEALELGAQITERCFFLLLTSCFSDGYRSNAHKSYRGTINKQRLCIDY